MLQMLCYYLTPHAPDLIPAEIEALQTLCLLHMHADGLGAVVSDHIVAQIDASERRDREAMAQCFKQREHGLVADTLILALYIATKAQFPRRVLALTLNTCCLFVRM
jgi:hypothetical protein